MTLVSVRLRDGGPRELQGARLSQGAVRSVSDGASHMKDEGEVASFQIAPSPMARGAGGAFRGLTSGRAVECVGRGLSKPPSRLSPPVCAPTHSNWERFFLLSDVPVGYLGRGECSSPVQFPPPPAQLSGTETWVTEQPQDVGDDLVSNACRWSGEFSARDRYRQCGA